MFSARSVKKCKISQPPHVLWQGKKEGRWKWKRETEAARDRDETQAARISYQFWSDFGLLLSSLCPSWLCVPFVFSNPVCLLEVGPPPSLGSNGWKKYKLQGQSGSECAARLRAQQGESKKLSVQNSPSLQTILSLSVLPEKKPHPLIAPHRLTAPQALHTLLDWVCSCVPPLLVLLPWHVSVQPPLWRRRGN